MNETLTYVRFYGHLRKRFGCGHRLAVKSPGEAVRALCHVLPGFEKYMREHSAPGYRVLAGREDVDVKLLEFQTGRADIRIVPAVTGAGGDFGKVILGAALIGASFIPGLNVAVFAGFSTTFASVALNVGISMALAGVSGMIAGTPDAPTPTEAANNQPSFAFNGAVNMTAQGNAIPLAYGRMRVGSAVISAGLSVSQLAG